MFPVSSKHTQFSAPNFSARFNYARFYGEHRTACIMCMFFPLSGLLLSNVLGVIKSVVVVLVLNTTRVHARTQKPARTLKHTHTHTFAFAWNMTSFLQFLFLVAPAQRIVECAVDEESMSFTLHTARVFLASHKASVCMKARTQPPLRNDTHITHMFNKYGKPPEERLHCTHLHIICVVLVILYISTWICSIDLIRVGGIGKNNEWIAHTAQSHQPPIFCVCVMCCVVLCCRNDMLGHLNQVDLLTWSPTPCPYTKKMTYNIY